MMTPALMIPSLNSCGIDTQLARPVSDDLGFSVGCYSDIVPFVPVLMSARFPFAVIWRIWAVIVGSVYRVLAAGSAAHIFNEVLKRVFPARADCDPSAAVVHVRMVLFIKTPGFHFCPYAMFRRVVAFRCKAVSSARISVSSIVSLKTAAGSCMPGFKHVVTDRNDCSAVTMASPHGSPLPGRKYFRMVWADDDKARKARKYKQMYIHGLYCSTLGGFTGRISSLA